MLGVAIIAAILVALGGMLFFVGVITLESWSDVRTLVALVVIPFGAYFFVRVGRSIWRELKNERASAGKNDKDDFKG